MEFKSYNDIENVNRIKFINEIIEHGQAYGDWCVTEKCHGSNASFHIAKDSIKMAKRSGWIDDSEKNFYGHKEVLEEYNKQICQLFFILSESFGISPNVLKVSLYGELFGGVYPHSKIPKNNRATRVQKGVYYSPDNDFYAFDLMVNGIYLNYKIFAEMMEELKFLYAKPLYIGDMKSCMAFPNEFQTKLPQMLELPEIENNICEGVIIKPLDARFLPNGSRIILKNKNDKFSENEKTKKKIDKDSIEIIQLTEDNKVLAEEASQFVTENRLRNVISKIGQITEKDFSKLSGLLTQGTIKDWEKDREEIIEAVDKDQMKLIKNHIKKLCVDICREHFRNILDNTF